MEQLLTKKVLYLVFSSLKYVYSFSIISQFWEIFEGASEIEDDFVEELIGL